MNGKYGNNFVFAGADSLNAPFAINDKGFVTYRGVEIDNPDTWMIFTWTIRDSQLRTQTVRT